MNFYTKLPNGAKTYKDETTNSKSKSKSKSEGLHSNLKAHELNVMFHGRPYP